MSYAGDDPKHETYYERMADRADDERKQARERGEPNPFVEAMCARPGEPSCPKEEGGYRCALPAGHPEPGHFFRRVRELEGLTNATGEGMIRGQANPDPEEDPMAAKQRTTISETREHEGNIVHAYSIASTDIVVFEVWEPREIGHSTITTLDGREGWWGKLYTRDVTDELRALPYGDERTARVTAYWTELRAEAERVIAAAFPELDGKLSYQEGSASCFSWEFDGTIASAS